jgi:hypothetical protein
MWFAYYKWDHSILGYFFTLKVPSSTVYIVRCIVNFEALINILVSYRSFPE